jgi:hypothetical protein
MGLTIHLFIACMTGPGVVPCQSYTDCAGGCWEWRYEGYGHVCYGCCHRPDCKRSSDFDHDGDVDLMDYWLLQQVRG